MPCHVTNCHARTWPCSGYLNPRQCFSNSLFMSFSQRHALVLLKGCPMSPVDFTEIAHPLGSTTNGPTFRFPRSCSTYDCLICLTVSGFMVVLSFGHRCPAECARWLMICTWSRGRRGQKTDNRVCLSQNAYANISL